MSSRDICRGCCLAMGPNTAGRSQPLMFSPCTSDTISSSPLQKDNRVPPQQALCSLPLFFTRAVCCCCCVPDSDITKSSVLLTLRAKGRRPTHSRDGSDISLSDDHRLGNLDPPEGSNLTSTWEMMTDDIGVKEYYNTRTGETTSELPDNMI